MSTEKIRSVQDAADAVRRLRSDGKRVVFTNGCFDILHPGHIALLTAARAEGDCLVVGVNSDESVSRLKGAGRPVFDEHERAEVLAALSVVDIVCVFGEDTPLEAILGIRPDVLVKGADWKGDIVGHPEVEGWGGRVVAMDLVEGQSTTGIVERVLSSAPRR